MSLEPAIKQLFGPLPVAQYKAFLARYRDEYVDLNTTPTPLFESVTEVLTALKQEQHVIAVATGKARRGLDRVWQETAMHDVFASSRCADESESKPHPKMLYELMTELQFLPQQTVMVGDSVHDMRMAKAAGVTAIGVDFGVHDSNRLTAAGADIVISKLQQLPPFIKQLTDTRQ